MDRYPYFLYPAISELKETSDAPRKARLRELIAANVGPRDALAALIGPAEADILRFYPDTCGTGRDRDRAIDSFIAKFGGAATQTVLFPEPLPPAQPEEKKPGPEEEEKPSPAPENALEKVKILVKNRNFEEALAIMEDFYLNNPKKSVYFADQIRFIRKMMLNERKK